MAKPSRNVKPKPRKTGAIRGERKSRPDDTARAERDEKRVDDLLELIIPIGVALLAERDFNRLLERILLGAMSLCNADGGTLYLLSEDKQLRFAMVRNVSMNIAMGGTTGIEIPFHPLPLYDPQTNQPNLSSVATCAALEAETIIIPDAYFTNEFDFSGTRAFDKQTGYRSTSFLTVPLKDSKSRVIGVLQLLNALEPKTNKTIPFDPMLQRIIESLSLLAAGALEAYTREQELREQLDLLRIQLDETRISRQVNEITETDYFQNLRQKADQLRDHTVDPS